MSYFITVKDGDTTKDYKIPTFGEFTIAEWVRLHIPANTEEGDAKWMEEVKRMTGIPLKALRRLSIAEYDKLLDAYLQLRKEASDRQAEVDGTDFKNPEFIEHEGVKYAVSQDLEQVPTGQWIDLSAALAKANTEPEIMQAVCEAMLVEEGKEYTPLKGKFSTLPVRVAMGLMAFFLSRSERLRTSIAQCSTRRVMSLLQEHGLGVAPSTKPTAQAGTT